MRLRDRLLELEGDAYEFIYLREERVYFIEVLSSHLRYSEVHLIRISVAFIFASTILL